MYFLIWENIKSREVTGGVFESAPSASPDSFFQLGQKHIISNFKGRICPTCFETGGAYAHSAPQLCTPLVCILVSVPLKHLILLFALIFFSGAENWNFFDI